MKVALFRTTTIGLWQLHENGTLIWDPKAGDEHLLAVSLRRIYDCEFVPVRELHDLIAKAGTHLRPVGYSELMASDMLYGFMIDFHAGDIQDEPLPRLSETEVALAKVASEYSDIRFLPVLADKQ